MPIRSRSKRVCAIDRNRSASPIDADTTIYPLTLGKMAIRAVESRVPIVLIGVRRKRKRQTQRKIHFCQKVAHKEESGRIQSLRDILSPRHVQVH